MKVVKEVSSEQKREPKREWERKPLREVQLARSMLMLTLKRGKVEVHGLHMLVLTFLMSSVIDRCF